MHSAQLTGNLLALMIHAILTTMLAGGALETIAAGRAYAQAPAPVESSRVTTLSAPSTGLPHATARLESASDSTLPTGRIPLAPREGRRRPVNYPMLYFGFGLRTFRADFSGLAVEYGETPSFGLSPMLSLMGEIALSRALALQIDGGTSFVGGENYGRQGMASLVVYADVLPNSSLRPYLGSGLAVCSIRGEDDAIITLGGATGYHVTAGLEGRFGWSSSLNLYVAYCAYPRVSMPRPIGDEENAELSMDFTGAQVGVRIKEPIW